MVPLATEILLEGTDGLLRPAPEGNGGHRSTPLVFSRGGSLRLLFMLTAALPMASSHSEGTFMTMV